MDITLYKTKNFSMIIPPKASSSYEASSSSGRYFGPPVNYKESNDITKFSNAESTIADPAYAPYVPPYYYGKSVVRVKYRADKARVTVDDIISKLEYEVINTDLDDLITNAQGSTGSISYLNRMTLDSSLQLKGKELVPTSVKSGFIEIQASNDPVNAAENTKWVISTKWECPTMNFNDENANNKPYDTGDLMSSLNSNLTWSYPTAGTGIWSGYSNDYNEKEGIFLKLEESFNGNLASNTGSLIDLCGFQVSEKRVGTLADVKEISEAVVVMPYYEKNLYTEIFDTKTETFKRKQTKNEISLVDEKHEFIKLNKDKFITAVKYVEQNKNTIDLENPPNSLIDLVSKMDKYELPRHLDFLKDIKQNKQLAIYPSAMYIFEFKRRLDKEELGDIWQGVMPEAALIAKKDSITISHPLTDTELLTSIEKPENLKWLVFKVKRKAEKFYDSLTDFSDERFKTINQATSDNAGYNWPYDYFSLVELANVEVKFDIFNDEFYDVEKREVVINPQQPIPELKIIKQELFKKSSSNISTLKKLPVTDLINNVKNLNTAKETIKKIVEEQPNIQDIVKNITKKQVSSVTVTKPDISLPLEFKKEIILTDLARKDNIITEKQPTIQKQKIDVKTPLVDKIINKEPVIDANITKEEKIDKKLVQVKKTIVNKKKG
jgi:hypothetical protein